MLSNPVRRLAIVAGAVALTAAAGCAGPRVPAGTVGFTPYPLAAPPQAGEIYHVPTGIRMDFDSAMDMIAAAKVVYVGEMHVNVQAHEVQRRIIAELERRFPGKVAVGMEMFREPQQESLDRWTRGELTEVEFLRESRWFDNWGGEFGNYRGILELARDRKIDVVALNPSKELQKAFAASETLPPELEGKVPETDFSDPFQRALLEAVFKGHDIGPKVFDRFFRTQIIWEETMAARVVDYLESPAGEGKRMVVIAGGFHVRHGLGVPRKVLRRRSWPYAIVLPVEVAIPEEKRAELVMENVEPPEIPLLPGDFVFMVDYEDLAGTRVRLGVMLASDEQGRVKVEKVVDGSPAAAAGILAGDRFVSFDGEAVKEPGDVVAAVSVKKPGDTARIVLERDGAEVVVLPVLELPPAAPAPHGGKRK